MADAPSVGAGPTAPCAVLAACRGDRVADATRPDGEPPLSARFERRLASRATARAASRRGRLDADSRHARAVGVRRPARSRSRGARAAIAARRPRRCLACGRHATRRSRRSRAPRVLRAAPHLPRAAVARALRRLVHHRVSGLSRASRSRTEGRVHLAVRARLPGSVGGGVGTIGRWRYRRGSRLEEPRLAADRDVARTQSARRRRCDRCRVARHHRRDRGAHPHHRAAAARA